MKTKIISVIGVFVLLALGTMIVFAEDAKATTTTVSFEEAASGYNVQPAGSCTRICTKCLPIGHGGACTTSGSCC